MSGEETEIQEKITSEACNLILDHAESYSIDDQKMKEMAHSLGVAIGGAHLLRKGEGLHGMKAILVDWWKKGNLTKLDTIQALEVLINIFEERSISLNDLAYKLKQVKEKRVQLQGDQTAVDSNTGQKTVPVTNVISGTPVSPNDAATKEDGPCLGHMKAPPVSDDNTDAKVYNMDHELRGKAVIFNNMDFDHVEGDLGYRTGSKKDADDIERVLKKLDFDVDKYVEYTSTQIRGKLRKIADDKEEMNADSDCLLVVVLSHGDDDDKIAAQDKWYEDEDLWNPFLAENCPSLRGKPKLFFLNACRGDRKDKGAETDNRGEKKKVKRSKLPNHADFLIARSTVPGYSSWRNLTEGSYFIQALREVLDPEKGGYDDDLLSLLVKAQGIVATNEMGDRNKQMPSFTCQLTKKMQMKDNKKKDS